jgi:hypothetical protein
MPTWTDRTGVVRMLGRRPITSANRKMRAARTSFTDYLRAQGMSLIPRSQWVAINRRDVLGTQFVNDQQQCSGCVGY